MKFSKEYQYTRNKNGVYALIEDNEIVYIGFSKNIYTRLLEHKTDGEKNFNKVVTRFFPPSNDDTHIDKIFEMGIICKLKPKHNKIIFDNFRYWIYSLPHVEFTNDEITRIVAVADKIAGEITSSMGDSDEHR